LCVVAGSALVAVSFKRLQVDAVLGESAALADVVKVTTFITNRYAGMVAKYDRVFGEFFPTARPTSTLVEVKSLVLSEMLVEIEAVAVVGAGT
jgi:enamine deaminase RidA (YjgF/YER057c/UK114 family)